MTLDLLFWCLELGEAFWIANDYLMVDSLLA